MTTSPVSVRPARRISLGGLPALLAALAVLGIVAGGARCRAVGPMPAQWPSRQLELGMADPPGGAAAMRATASFRLRYQYLSGGVNTGKGWATWNPDGAFVTNYIQDSGVNGITPVFTYYQMFQSAPGNGRGEADGVYANMQDTSTMHDYFNDLKLFFQRAGAFPQTVVVLHVEPDLWGYMQRRADNDDASTVPAKVGATGVPELSGVANNVAGFAKAIGVLRDAYAPNVLLAYHMSIWGTGQDIIYSNPPDSEVDALAMRAAAFFNSLGGEFDVSFVDGADRDAAFKQYINGDNGASWYDAADYARHVRFLSTYGAMTQRRIVVWQIPYGNTKMRAVNNTWDHFQDNHVEWLLDDPTREHLNAYVQAGVIAFLFGRGADGATCACDAARDGVTDPPPINGNGAASLSADDDGGFFREQAQRYYAAGPIALPEP